MTLCRNCHLLKVESINHMVLIIVCFFSDQLGVISNAGYEVLDSTKITNGDAKDVVIIRDQLAKYKCLQLCNKLLDCLAVNINQGPGHAVTCQILRNVQLENQKVSDTEWQLLFKCEK